MTGGRTSDGAVAGTAVSLPPVALGPVVEMVWLGRVVGGLGVETGWVLVSSLLQPTRASPPSAIANIS
jgi:hypothetical protein